MKTAWREWFVVGVLLATTAYVVAEELSLTTCYPSPKGAYQTLSSTSSSHFATYEGGVGIGTADPGTAKLAVMGGNVGIGTTNPGDFRLDVLSANGPIRISRASHGVGGMGGILFGGYNANDALTSYAFITSNSTADTPGAESGSLDFYTANAGTLGSPKVSIISNGNVGIGTTDPNVGQLTIAGGLGAPGPGIGLRRTVAPTDTWWIGVHDTDASLRFNSWNGDGYEAILTSAGDFGIKGTLSVGNFAGGSANAYVCVHPDGTLYRSTTGNCN